MVVCIIPILFKISMIELIIIMNNTDITIERTVQSINLFKLLFIPYGIKIIVAISE